MKTNIAIDISPRIRFLANSGSRVVQNVGLFKMQCLKKKANDEVYFMPADKH